MIGTPSPDDDLRARIRWAVNVLRSAAAEFDEKSRSPDLAENVRIPYAAVSGALEVVAAAFDFNLDQPARVTPAKGAGL